MALTIRNHLHHRPIHPTDDLTSSTMGKDELFHLVKDDLLRPCKNYSRPFFNSIIRCSTQGIRTKFISLARRLHFPDVLLLFPLVPVQICVFLLEYFPFPQGHLVQNNLQSLHVNLACVIDVATLIVMSIPGADIEDKQIQT